MFNYELGYAHGIGNHALNILLAAHEGSPIHFDLAASEFRGLLERRQFCDGRVDEA